MWWWVIIAVLKNHSTVEKTPFKYPSTTKVLLLLMFQTVTETLCLCFFYTITSSFWSFFGTLRKHFEGNTRLLFVEFFPLDNRIELILYSMNIIIAIPLILSLQKRTLTEPYQSRSSNRTCGTSQDCWGIDMNLVCRYKNTSRDGGSSKL